MKDGAYVTTEAFLSLDNEQKRHYDAIDGLRVFAAVGIVLMHVLDNGHFNMDGFVFERIIPSFTDFVYLFMEISGFSMCCGYYKKIVNGRITLEEFYSKRYKKIWPFFALLCVLDLVISPSEEAVYEVFANLTLAFGFLNKPISVIGVGWFLGVVFIFYLVFPFFCYLLSDKKRAWLSFVVCLIFNIVCSGYFEISRTNFLFCTPYFMCGGVIYLYKDDIEKIIRKRFWLFFWSIVLLTVAYYTLPARRVISLALSALILMCTLGISDDISSILKNIMRFLSDISMEIYLSHMVIFRLLEKIGIARMMSGTVWGYITLSATTLAATIVFAIIIRWMLRRLQDLYI